MLFTAAWKPAKDEATKECLLCYFLDFFGKNLEIGSDDLGIFIGKLLL